MNDSQYETDNKFFTFFLVILSIAVGGIIGYQMGHLRGVRDHAAGKYVIVELPNGDTMVCETKEKP